jgi:hypothetical protein
MQAGERSPSERAAAIVLSLADRGTMMGGRETHG